MRHQLAYNKGPVKPMTELPSYIYLPYFASSFSLFRDHSTDRS